MQKCSENCSTSQLLNSEPLASSKQACEGPVTCEGPVQNKHGWMTLHQWYRGTFQTQMLLRRNTVKRLVLQKPAPFDWLVFVKASWLIASVCNLSNGRCDFGSLGCSPDHCCRTDLHALAWAFGVPCPKLAGGRKHKKPGRQWSTQAA